VTMKTVYKWFERFRNGCESVEDEERSYVCVCVCVCIKLYLRGETMPLRQLQTHYITI